jgi:hypothetical protein
MYSRYSHISTNMPSSSGSTLLGSHSIVSKDSGLLVHGAVSLGELTFLPLRKRCVSNHKDLESAQRSSTSLLHCIIY